MTSDLFMLFYLKNKCLIFLFKYYKIIKNYFNLKISKIKSIQTNLVPSTNNRVHNLGNPKNNRYTSKYILFE